MKKLIKYKKIILLIMFIFLLSISFNNYGIWTDEVYTLNMIKNSFEEILKICNSFDSTTFYYIMLKLATSFIDISNYKVLIIFSRIFSAIPTLILLFIGDKKISKIFDEKFGLYFILTIFGCNFVYYSIEIRIYSWAVLFTTLASIELIDYFKNNSRLLMFSVYSILSFYCHATTAIPLSILYLYLFIDILLRKKYKNLICFFITIVGCLPEVLYVFLTNLNSPATLYSSGAINPVFSINKIKETIVFPFDTGFLYLSLFLIVIYFISFVWYLKKKNDYKIIYGLIVLPITCIILMLIAYASNHDYYPKYMIVSIGILYVSLSYIIYKINKKELLILITIINTISCINIMISEFKAIEGFKKIDYYMTNEFEGESIVTNFDYGKYILEFYDFKKLENVDILFSNTFIEFDGYYFIRKDIIDLYFGTNKYEVIYEFNISNDIYILCLTN